MECDHDWRPENINTTLREGRLIHAVVVCNKCMTIKAPLKTGVYQIEGWMFQRVNLQEPDSKVSL